MFTKQFLNEMIGKYIRIVVYNKKRISIDLMIRNFEDKFISIFENYKFIDYHVTPVNGCIVIEMEVK